MWYVVVCMKCPNNRDSSRSTKSEFFDYWTDTSFYPSTNELRRIAHCQQSNWKKNKFGKIIKMLREEGGLFLKILWSSSFEVSDAETNLSTVDNFSFPKNQFLSHCQSPILQILFTTSLDRHQKQGDRNSWFLKWISVNLKCFFFFYAKNNIQLSTVWSYNIKLSTSTPT